MAHKNESQRGYSRSNERVYSIKGLNIQDGKFSRFEQYGSKVAVIGYVSGLLIWRNPMPVGTEISLRVQF
jgi:hypothetical protein